MNVGFSGTQEGMTTAQKNTLTYLLRQIKDTGDSINVVNTLRHGRCVGADEEAGIIAMSLGFNVYAYPGDNLMKRSTKPCYHTSYPPQGNLARNKEIVKHSEILIATPKDYERPTNLRGQGTWTTIHYASQKHIPRYIILPDGGWSMESKSEVSAL